MYFFVSNSCFWFEIRVSDIRIVILACFLLPFVWNVLSILLPEGNLSLVIKFLFDCFLFSLFVDLFVLWKQ